MKSGAEGVDHAAARSFAIENGFVGAGWALTDAPDPDPLPDGCNDAQQYLRHAKEIYPDDSSLAGVVQILSADMKKGDFCWMYETHTGEYWCAHVDDDTFEYRRGRAFDRFDLHLIRHCTWARAGAADAVPGVIRRAFATPFGTIGPMRTDSNIAIEAAEIVLGRKTPAPDRDLFGLASPEDLEDVAALYLQARGWRLLPSTAKVSMASYEFVLVHAETGKRAGVQVKSGTVSYLDQKVAAEFDSFFVFLANPSAVLAGDLDKIERISRDELSGFARANWELLPQRLKARWTITRQSQ